MNYKTLGLLAGSLVLFGFAARQSPFPAPFSRDLSILGNANYVNVTVALRLTGEAPTEYQVMLAKPNLYKIAGPDGFVQSDGQMVYTYDKAKNTYFQTPASDTDLESVLKRPEVFGWAPLLQKDAATRVAAARLGNTRNITGTMATEVNVTMKTEGVRGTLYIDQRLGVPKGYELSVGGKDYLALASSVVVGTDAVPTAQYAFTAPDGAKKTEAPKPDDATYTNVAAIMTASCMPCHNSQQHSGGADLSSYQGVLRTVTPGNGAASRLVTILKPGPGRMPQGRAPLSDAQIQQIQKWIDAGAKNN